MEKPARTPSAPHHVTPFPPSPLLLRSRSGSGAAVAALTTPERSSHRVLEKKSRDDSFGKKRGVDPKNNVEAPKKATSPMKSPSAWALSPGRWSLRSPTWSQPPAKANVNSNMSVGGGVNKVLKYFRQKKVSPLQEEEYHRFRILQNRLLQWRFMNARADIAMANVKNMAEIQLFCVWVRMVRLRKKRMEKRVELGKMKHVLKLYKIVNGQLHLLNEWSEVERRNQESVARLARKLSASSTILPSTHVKGDTESIFEALNSAIKVMESMEPLIAIYQTKGPTFPKNLFNSATVL
ncbi:unnamed protein product [Sphenostylis stenocarpa]|uniref:QWRF motif-containing protein 7 n=1 Tax=Sphenostylis stenocarpa TaxID=92480 RepID=A0AA86VJ14_9FABA|nr:unnamed protein product [Sphenostylis stenocarpa]